MFVATDLTYCSQHARCRFCLSTSGTLATGLPPTAEKFEDLVDHRRFTCDACGWVGRVHDKVPMGDADVKPLLVGAAVVLRNKVGQFLTSVRSSTGAFPGSYQVPGGVVKLGEKPIEAALREVKEETGLTLQANHLRFLGRWRAKHPQGEYIVVMYLCRWADEKVPAEHLEPDKQSPWIMIGQDVLLEKTLIPGLREALYAANNIPPPPDLKAMEMLRKYQGTDKPFTDDEIREATNPKVQLSEKEQVSRMAHVLYSLGFDYVDESVPAEDRVLKIAGLLQGFGEGQVRAFAQMKYPPELIKAHAAQYAQVAVFMRDLYELVRSVSHRYRQTEDFLKTSGGIAMSQSGKIG